MWYYFFLKEGSSVVEGEEELLSLGALHIAECSEGEKIFFCAELPEETIDSFRHIAYRVPIEEAIDWALQWETFCPYWEGGEAKIPLKEFCPGKKGRIRMKPGPGFGDLSHPTTLIAARLTASLASGEIVVDIGSGSGILTLTALAFGARFVHALDIDPSARSHTEENVLLNGFSGKAAFSEALSPEVHPDLVLLNMTFAEQKIVLASLLDFSCPLWVVSGIWEGQKEEYLCWMEEKGFIVQKEAKKGEWLGWILRKI